jgi:putative ABC transport system permease protein
MTPISLKLAWRETASSWSRFFFLFLCIALGVGAIVAVDLFATNVEQVILGDARGLLGGDIELSWRRAMSKNGQEVLDSLSERKITLSHITELAAMAAVESSQLADQTTKATSQLVELKALDSFYPLYGSLMVEPAQATEQLLAPIHSGCQRLPCFGAIAQKSLLIRLNLGLGSELRIGHTNFLITGILVKEPDKIATAFSLGPRVMISREALDRTELVKTGSRIHERYRLQLPPSTNLEPWLGELRGRLSREGVQVNSYRDAQPRLRRFLDQLTLYLGLIGLTILLVGGIGVACTMQGFITQKTPIIATLKTLGADSPQVIKIYLTQSLLLGGIGSLAGGILGTGLHQGMPLLLQGIIPDTFPIHPTLTPILRGMALGTLATLAFSLWPLLAIRHVSPALVFRRDVDQSTFQIDQQPWATRWMTLLKNWWKDRVRRITSLSIAGCLLGLAIWQAHSLSLGLFFSGAFILAIFALLCGTSVLFWILRHIQFPQKLLLRHATNNLQRPGNFTKAMALAIGIGVMLMITLITVQRTLLDLIEDQIPTSAPSFFFIDIQPDQYASFKQVLENHIPGVPYNLVPIVRSRLTEIDGRPIHPEEHKGKRNGWYFTREYVLTTFESLPKDNALTQGQWWGKPPRNNSVDHPQARNNLPLVSVEEDAAKNLGLSLGSNITFNIQGVPFVAKVSSLRTVDWGSFSMNFFMIMEPGSLDGAPITYIATARVPKTVEIPLQHAIVSDMPNVTAIHVGDVMDNIAKIFRQLAMGIQALALLCLITGGVVMIAAISINRYRRQHELAILKALGGGRGLLLFSLGTEFGLIGGFAGLVGLGLGCLLSWSILHFFFDLTWTINLTVLWTGLLLTIVLTLVTGFLGTYRLLGLSPLSVLRQE